MKSRLLVLPAFVWATLAPVARAEERLPTPPPAHTAKVDTATDATPTSSATPLRFVDRPTSVNLVLGVGPPTGEIGMTVEYSCTDWFAAGAGAGGALGGPQGAVSGRFRLGRFETATKAEGVDVVTAVSLGSYYSSGMKSWCDDSGCWKALGLWTQAALDYELLVDHFHLAAGFGGGVMAARLQTTILPGVQGVVQQPGNPIVVDLHVAVGVAL